ncbi:MULTISPECIES: STAS domain-containing protein [Planctopirus]|uniref:STAS domain-containing protein n=2 Tax=Planctopirus TaxID=1649480 RepID=A0A1C3E9V5_9PLAN|nr:MULTISPECIES: hypothetical protein [Planctopirus]ODA30000.1 hypothetical protein A6X21_06590 [Planctopirus hydrillae]QDV28231.1 hypothetical protein Spb1_00940 [Planctopirus ephydatiae]
MIARSNDRLHKAINVTEDATMKVERFFKRMRIEPHAGHTLLHIGDMEIWDGADLALLREGLTQIIERDRDRDIAVDMTFVKYIPSGFFGMLFDWFEKRKVQFYLLNPQPNVQSMLWFRQFFEPCSAGLWRLEPKGLRTLPVMDDAEISLSTLEAMG